MHAVYPNWTCSKLAFLTWGMFMQLNSLVLCIFHLYSVYLYSISTTQQHRTHIHTHYLSTHLATLNVVLYPAHFLK